MRLFFCFGSYEPLYLTHTNDSSIVYFFSLDCSIDVLTQCFIIDVLLSSMKKAAAYLPYYFTSPGQDGAWDQGVIQWHESGEYWEVN